MTTDRITIATDMARERREAAGLGNGMLYDPVTLPDGSINLIATLTVSAADIDEQIKLLRERGVERKAEDGVLGDEDLESIANALQQDGRGIESILVPGEPMMMVREIQRSRAAIARVEALIGTLRATLGLCEARHIEAALRGEVAP